jgi:hypothetical protein
MDAGGREWEVMWIRIVGAVCATVDMGLVYTMMCMVCDVGSFSRDSASTPYVTLCTHYIGSTCAQYLPVNISCVPLTPDVREYLCARIFS